MAAGKARSPRPARHDRRGPAPLAIGAAALAAVLLPACMAGGPQSKTVVTDRFALEPAGGSSTRTRGDVSVEDAGEATGVSAPVRVQACRGGRLEYRKVRRREKTGYRWVESKDKKGKARRKRVAEYETVTERRPVHETVDPLAGLHIRELAVHNDSAHVLPLNRVHAVMVDAAGNDNESLSKPAIRDGFLRARPCPSSDGALSGLRGLKLLGGNIRVLPGRTARLLVAFSGIDKRILGDWALELHGFPVATDAAGRVSRVASFSFPLVARGWRETVEMHRESLFAPWTAGRRTTTPIGPGS